jgi:hypothetical protein
MYGCVWLCVHHVFTRRGAFSDSDRNLGLNSLSRQVRPVCTAAINKKEGLQSLMMHDERMQPRDRRVIQRVRHLIRASPERNEGSLIKVDRGNQPTLFVHEQTRAHVHLLRRTRPHRQVPARILELRVCI